jgi:uncharacterized membrane protein
MPPVAPEIVLQLVYFTVGTLLVLLGLPLYFRRVPPNRFYGFRTGRTLADPAAWYAVNRVAGGWLVVTGAATAGVATAVEWLKLSIPAAAGINCAVFLVGMSLMLIQSIRTLWRMK